MAVKKSKSKKCKKPYRKIFTALYITGFVGAGLIGLLSNSFFAYDIFNGLWADVLYALFISLLYVTAFAQEVCISHRPKCITANFFIFIVSLFLFLLMLYFGGVFIVIALFYSAAMACFVAVQYVFKLRSGKAFKVNVKYIICICSLLLFAMINLLLVEFVNETYMAWSFIPAAVFSCVACLTAYFILKSVWKTLFETKLKRITYSVFTALCIFFVAYMYTFAAVGMINCVFDGQPVKTEYEVLDKHIQSGARQITQFELKIEIDGEYKWIDVPVTDYHNISVGEVIIVDYFDGALGFPYWKYYGISQ